MNSRDGRGAAVAAFVDELIARSEGDRHSSLFSTRHSGSLVEVGDRNGVSVVALPTSALAEAELVALMRFRLVQYLLVGFVDARATYERGMEHEPLSQVSESDVHVVAGSAEDGRILCYVVLRGVRVAHPNVSMRSRARTLFPVEDAHGAGIFDRVPALSDLPAVRVRELGRLVKNQHLHAFDELGLRAPVETCLAVVRAMTGPLRRSVDALIGDMEEGVADRNMAFFHFPIVTIRGTVGFEPDSAYLSGRYQHRTVYPFAGLSSDLAVHASPRADAIEQALELPGRRGIAALLRLKRETNPPRSRLDPPDGLPALTTRPVPHGHLTTSDRQLLRDAGERLRRVGPLERLTVAEGTVLATLLRRRLASAGELLVRTGDRDDALFVIDSGHVDIRLTDLGGRSRVVRTLGVGDHYGEIALLMGITRTADVVATEPTSVLVLSKHRYDHFLAGIADVDSELTRIAVNRLAVQHPSVGRRLQ